MILSGDQTHSIIIDGVQDGEPGTYAVAPTQYIAQHEVPAIPPPPAGPPAQPQTTHQQVSLSTIVLSLFTAILQTHNLKLTETCMNS